MFFIQTQQNYDHRQPLPCQLACNGWRTNRGSFSTSFHCTSCLELSSLALECFLVLGFTALVILSPSTYHLAPAYLLINQPLLSICFPSSIRCAPSLLIHCIQILYLVTFGCSLLVPIVLVESCLIDAAPNLTRWATSRN